MYNATSNWCFFAVYCFRYEYCICWLHFEIVISWKGSDNCEEKGNGLRDISNQTSKEAACPHTVEIQLFSYW